ncbi:restriction endonuclease subunit S [Shewanella sp. HL-SH4]|uniref:restriction endonuclease subunit S n=1 Tax=Shewanella sp. HL-SH4 TaxID=3436240 RepID=UPI003EB8BB55
MADPMLNRHSSEDGNLDSTSSESLITNHINIWTTAIERKSSVGRGTSKKFSLYGIKKLRELILELAVRGKLVPQDVNDEPASVLLKRIAAEKAQLVKEGKLKKQKPLPKLKIDEVDFNLPVGWAIAYIPEVVAYDKYAIKRGPFGSALKKAYFVSDGVKVYEQQHAIKDDFALGEYYITEEKFKELSPFEVKPNDLIISCSGTVGKVAVAPEWMHKGIINQALLKITLNQAALTNAYFKILFPAFYMQTVTLSDLQGTAQKNMVSVDTLKNEPFPFPSLEEQHRIVAKVDELMSLCDALEAQTEASIAAHQTLVETLLNALLLPNITQQKDSQSASPEPALNDSFIDSWQRVAEHFDTLFTTAASIDTLKQTILQLAVMGKLVPQDPNDEPATKLLERIAAEKAQLIKDGRIKKQKTLPVITDEEKSFELPNGWVYTRLDELCLSVSSGSTPPKSELNETSGIPFLKVYNIQNQVIDFEERTLFVSEGSHLGKLKRSILYPGDVVMNLVGPPLGKIAIIPNTYPEWNCNQNIICFRPLEIRLNLYIYTYLTAQIFLNQIELVGSAGQDFISGTKSRAIVLPFPPLEEQHRIVAKVDELMTLCDQLKARLSDAQTTQLHLTDAIVEQAM